MLVTTMKKLRIKIGGSMDTDIKGIKLGVSKLEPGTHTHYVKNVEELCELLTPKKLEMLIDALNYYDKPRTIKEHSIKTRRKQEAVSRDATFLTKHSLIEKIRKGRTALLKAKYDTLEICLAK